MLEKRRLGRTGHESTVAILGAFCLSNLSQEQADKVMEHVINAGINHIDVAPSYGIAEKRLGPWMERERERFFLGCKTMERTKKGAAAELRESRSRLRVDRFDLYQLHAVTTMDELDAATQADGALEAIIQARTEGLTRFIGITSHGVDSPVILTEALNRFDFDTVLFPINFIQYSDEHYRKQATELLGLCQEKQVGSMIIKSIARGPWGDKTPTHGSWYEPFTEIDDIQKAVNFVLAQEVTGLCTVGDATLFSLVLKACENYQKLAKTEQELLMKEGLSFEPLFK